MFTSKRFSVVLVLMLVMMLFAAPVAYAQDDDPTPEPESTTEPSDVTVVVEEAPVEDPAPTQEVGLSLDSVIALLIFLLGFFPILGGSVGTLISTLVDIIKSTGLLKDGWAALPLLLLNFLAIVLLYMVFGLKPGDAIPAELDTTLRQLTDFIATMLILGSSLGFGRLFHEKVLKPMSSAFSHTRRNAPKPTLSLTDSPRAGLRTG